MPIVPLASELISERLAVTLALYARYVPGVDECGLFGVAGPSASLECGGIWTRDQREMLARHLAEAQEEIENTVGYLLSPEWISGTLAGQPDELERFVDERPWKLPLMARWGHIFEVGQRAETVIRAGAAVNHAADPAVIGPYATTAVNVEEIRIYHPGTDVEIDPSRVVLSGGNVTIYVPRCRMVTAADWDNPSTGLDYTDTSVTGPFEQTVDVKRVYTDPSVNAVLVYPHACTGASSGCSCACGEYTQDACLWIRDSRLGALDALPATYSSGAWVASSYGVANCSCRVPERVRLYYRAGLKELTRQQALAIIRLAHSKMPNTPCGCDITTSVWEADRHIPEVQTRERINCAFGISDGAWFAWKQAQAMRLVKAGVL